MFSDLKEHDYEFLFALLISNIVYFDQLGLKEEIDRCYSCLIGLINDFVNEYGEDNELINEVNEIIKIKL